MGHKESNLTNKIDHYQPSSSGSPAENGARVDNSEDNQSAMR